MTGAIEKLGAEMAKVELDPLTASVGKYMPRFLAISPNTEDVARRHMEIMLSLCRGADLSKCTPLSVMLAVHSVMRIGRNPDPMFGNVWVIPRKIKGVWTACVQMGYKGLMGLARDSGVTGIRAELLHDGDLFDYVGGMEQSLKHEPCWLFGKEPGEIMGAYVIWHDEAARKQVAVVSKHGLDKRRKVSQMANGPAWSKWPEEMYLKTALIYASRYWPVTPEMGAAIKADQEGELDEPQTSAARLRADAIEVPDLPTETEKMNEEMGGE